jgi:hypothetical protein
LAEQPNTAQYEAVLTTTADAFLSELFPESLLTATDKALHAFESDVQTLQDQADGHGSVLTACSGRRTHPDSLAEAGGVQRGTRAPGRSAHPPSWLTVVG